MKSFILLILITVMFLGCQSKEEKSEELIRQGISYQENKEHEKAINCYTKVIENIASDNKSIVVNAYCRRAACKLILRGKNVVNNYLDIFEDCQNAIKIDDSYAEPYSIEASVYFILYAYAFSQFNLREASKFKLSGCLALSEAKTKPNFITDKKSKLNAIDELYKEMCNY